MRLDYNLHRELYTPMPAPKGRRRETFCTEPNATFHQPSYTGWECSTYQDKGTHGIGADGADEYSLATV